MPTKKILIVDDEKNFRTTLGRTILSSGIAGIKVEEAASGNEALELVHKNSPNLVLMDIQMPGTSGFETFIKMKEANPKLTVIMMTGLGTTETAIESMKLGAYDYITKPFDVNKIKEVISKALQADTLMEEIVKFEDVTGQEPLSVRSIMGMSSAMQEIYKTIGQVASSDVSVLITGASGTGKELVARAIYHHSQRNNKHFLAINCSAIPDTLLESELFGYEKGAFTGANERRIGKFEQCNGGTIFLDEIGDMAGSTQSKILRVLQEGEIERLGGADPIKVDVRVISATHRDLSARIKEGKFREDLYYRLNVVNINIPSLKDRKEDIPDLVKYFLKRFNSEFKKKINEVPSKAMEQLLNYSWPGNVRELENAIKRAVVMTVGKTLQFDPSVLGKTEEKITLADVEGLAKGSFHEVLEKTLEALFQKAFQLPEDEKERKDLLAKIEEVLIKKSLLAFNGNQVKTSQLLGITRNTLRSRMEQFELKK
ncbi:MAG: sigma-54 dependent transcriptional regulator [Candidatus Margulisbacteria bacterium]|nr:sigma-54 dependent transcriptional regulator [Candidatus Margulisiibacteriota bacterium]